MRNRGTGTVAAASVVTLIAGLLTFMVMGPAQANHGSRTLQASPEIGFAPSGTAQIVTITLSAASTADTGPIEIDAEVTNDADGDTPETPDTGCVAAESNVCAFGVNGVSGTKFVKSWIDHDQKDELREGGVTELDRAEGRLAENQPDANPSAGAQTPPGADCRQPEDFAALDATDGFNGCEASINNDPADDAGAVSEPDLTDVVRLTWTAAKALDCVAAPRGRANSEDTRPVNTTGTGHGTDRFVQTTPPDVADDPATEEDESDDDNIVLDCTYSGPEADIRVDGANISARDDSSLDNSGANDPGAAAGEADYGQQNQDPEPVGVNAPALGCSADDSDTCTIVITPNRGQTGPAILCFWYDGDDDEAFSPAAEGTAGAGTGDDGEGCTEERVDNNEFDDSTDRLSVRWSEDAPALASIDLTPEASTGEVNTVRNPPLTATLLDQYGDPFSPARGTAAVSVGFEFFRGSPGDTDGASDASTPDRTCTVTADSAGRCAVTYRVTTPGTDVVCGWYGAAPTTLSEGARTCGNEGPTGDENREPRFDVVTFAWTSPSSSTTSTTNPNGGGGGTTTTTTPPPDDVSRTQGYTLVGADGGIFNFGTSQFHGSTGNMKLNEPVIGLANKAGGTGYWLVARDGGIFTFGDAEFFGSTGDQKLNAPVLGMEATPSGKGYYLFAADGGIFTFGDAQFYGSTGDMKLNAPAVGLAINERGDGYWLVAQDGGIFSFGNVPFHGSTGDRQLNQPVFDMAPTAGDRGYWLVAKDGGIFSFGDAAEKFYGSAVGATNSTVIGIGATPTFNGYWIADARGAVFPFGDARFLGDRRSATNNAPTVGFATVPKR